jgi:hypothetical protein
MASDTSRDSIERRSKSNKPHNIDVFMSALRIQLEEDLCAAEATIHLLQIHS